MPGEPEVSEGLTLEQTLWANTVVASGTAVVLVVYTGRDTRAVMNASQARSKVELDIFFALCVCCITPSVINQRFFCVAGWLQKFVRVRCYALDVPMLYVNYATL